jgi:AcrR family transcriptional regulator
MKRAETQKKILEIGKKEFLEKGFKDASLNQIVAEAGFTKGAFYGYYPDKTALFEDLVGETASELLTRFKAAQDTYFDLVPEGKAKDSLALSTQHLHEFVAFMYDHFDEFKLILCRAEGTRYANFLEELVELEVECSEEYYALLRKRGKLSGKMTRQLHHMITSAYFTAVCETIAHDMPKEEAMRYIEELAKFFNSGWKGLLRLE